MSQENVEIVRSAYEAFNRGDPDAMVADMGPDAEYVAGGAIPGVAEEALELPGCRSRRPTSALSKRLDVYGAGAFGSPLAALRFGQHRLWHSASRRARHILGAWRCASAGQGFSSRVRSLPS